jgi:class 3 adenylate cyclase
MVCPDCRHENSPSAKFCSECGTKLQQACPQCGIVVGITAKFCSECGASLAQAPLPPVGPSLEEQFTTFQATLPTSVREQLSTPTDGENRIVTILFTDMSGSVQATSHLHPEDAAVLVNNLLKEMVGIISKYEGRIDRFLGDGVLAVFGTPYARENDPERAIYAAIEIREAAENLGVSVTAGVNTGEVYFGWMGSAVHREITVMGPVVNLASRLQGKAASGQILVGRATYHHTRLAFEFEPISLELKGMAEPVTGYRVVRALPRPKKVRGIEGLQAELVGRNDEFAKLKAALAEVYAGRGQIVSVIGEAGMGKSRLVTEFKRIALASADLQSEAQSRPPLWLEGRCIELGMTVNYWSFIDAFREYFNWGPEDDDCTRGKRIVSVTQDMVKQGCLSEEQLRQILPLLGNLLSARFGNEWDSQFTDANADQIKTQTFTAIRDFFLALCKQQPLILFLEDLHWVDSLSLDMIFLLMEALTFAPLLLLCVYRPERARRCWELREIAREKCPGCYTELHLREFSPKQSLELVESLLRVENLPPSIETPIWEKSQGNPLFNAWCEFFESLLI